jgi:L-malate glycosyltransferase
MKRTAAMINILFIIPQMELGGTERLVYNLALKLDHDLFNPSLAWFFGDRIIKVFDDLDIPLYHVPKLKRFDISTMREIAKIIRDNNIHIVNAHHFMPFVYAYYGCKIANRKGLTCTIHSEWEIDKLSRKWSVIGRHLLNHADGTIGVTAQVSKEIKKNFNIQTSKLFTIQNGVDLQGVANFRKVSIMKRELCIADNDKVIGIVANFRKVKNHVFLLRAFHDLIINYRNVKLLLVGQGFEFDPENSEKEIRNFVNEKGLSNNVLMLGYRSDIWQLLNVIDIFCLTSLKEGLPISLIEAMAAGLPVVGTDVEGIRDVIIPNKNGFLVSIDDVNGLKESLLTLLKDEVLCQTMGKESKALAIDTYSLDRCITQYQNLFRSIMKNKGD